MYPWQKLAIVHTDKILIAKVDLSYTNPVNNEKIDHNSELPVHIEYDEIKKTWNTGVLIILIIIGIIWWRKKKNQHKKGNYN